MVLLCPQSLRPVTDPLGVDGCWPPTEVGKRLVLTSQTIFLLFLLSICIPFQTPAATLETAFPLLPRTEHVVVVGGMPSFDRHLADRSEEQPRSYEGRFDLTYPPDLDLTALLDWIALHRWGLKDAGLLSASLVLIRQLTFWDAYRQYVLAGIVLFLTQSAIIAALLWQWLRKRNAQAALLRAHERLRLALESGKCVGLEWDLATGRDIRFGDLRTVFGIPAATFTGEVGDFFRSIHAEDRERISKELTDARQSRGPYSAEFRIVWPDGTTRWVVSRGEFEYGRDGRAKRMLGMAVDITENKLAEGALKKSEEKFSKVFHESPLVLTLTNAHDHRYIEVNKTFEDTLGWSRDEVVGRTPNDLGIWVDPEERALFLQRLSTTGNVRNLAIHLRTKDGQHRTGLVSAELIDINGVSCALSVVADVTELRHAREMLLESQQRLENIVASAMDAIIAVDSRQRILVFNASAEEMFGCPAKDAILTPIDRFIPQRFRSAHKEHIRRFSTTGVTNRAMGALDSLWGLRTNGEEFPIEASISHVGTGEKKLLTVIIRDVTERRRAEEALSSVSRRLIEAHEQERTWVARELHDDIDQRIAFLAVKLDVLKREIPDSATEAKRRIREVKQLALSLGDDVQSLSHRLHSSKLEYLGLAAAATAFCREFSESQAVHIDLQCDVIPKSLPPEISLCLFRVLQEALQNSIKHSGARNFQVSLRYSLDQISLIVRDPGIGFDLEKEVNLQGLGITSMRERLKIVDGKLSIDSKPQQGTVVHASVPLSSSTKSAAVGKS